MSPIRRQFQFSLRDLLVAVTLFALLSAWQGPEVVRRLNNWWRREEKLDQVRPPFTGIVELYDPVTGKLEPPITDPPNELYIATA